MKEFSFTNDKYKNIALNKNLNNSVHMPSEAFFLLINGLEIENLDNLCKYIHKCYFDSSNDISLEECYNLTQNMNLDIKDKDSILNIAYICIEDGLNLGNKTTMNGKINTSSWINHCLFSGKFSADLAKILNLDENKAKTFGILHDYGRKFDHTFSHVIKGFESLIDIGWYDEAYGCLTHSFVKGGRCANNEKAVEGFYVDDDGNPRWEKDTIKDDISIFLDNYNYNEYDIILNIADLMATANGILSPYDRIQDIATRRKLDPTNRGYFLATFTNVLIDCLKIINPSINLNYIKADKNTKLEEIDNYIKQVSEIFYNNYKKITEIRNKYTI